MKTVSLHRLILVCALVWPFAACQNNNDDCDPTITCNTVEPSSAYIYVNLTINSENPYVPLAVYAGNASDSNLYFRDTVTASTSYSMPIGERYSVVAKYRQRGNTVYAVDGGKTQLESTTNCNETCYDTDDLTLNLKLID